MTLVEVLGCAVLTVSSLACGAPGTPAATPRSRPPLERFVEILERGESLYGLRAGCEAWRAGPEQWAVDDKEDTEATEEGDRDEDGDVDAVDKARERWFLRGRFTAHLPDAEGRIYAFSYALARDQDHLRMFVSGRGGWSPAPGVTIPSPNNDGFVIFGSATMCTVEVEVRSDPDSAEAILVGDERWYLSYDACVRERGVSMGIARRCSDLKKHARTHRRPRARR